MSFVLDAMTLLESLAFSRPEFKFCWEGTRPSSGCTGLTAESGEVLRPLNLGCGAVTFPVLSPWPQPTATRTRASALASGQPPDAVATAAPQPREARGPAPDPAARRLSRHHPEATVPHGLLSGWSVFFCKLFMGRVPTCPPALHRCCPTNVYRQRVCQALFRKVPALREQDK